MTKDIIAKLNAQLDAGIETEVQVVYLLAGIRKLIERDQAEQSYPDLKFHCDWALHSRMDRASALRMLKLFDDSHLQLMQRGAFSKLPVDSQRYLKQIAEMEAFKAELEKFLDEYGLPLLTRHREDGWVHFLRLYCKVIEDIPLFASVKAKMIKHISHVTVHLDDAKGAIKGCGTEEFCYSVRWIIHDKNGKSAKIWVINSFKVGKGLWVLPPL